MKHIVDAIMEVFDGAETRVARQKAVEKLLEIYRAQLVVETLQDPILKPAIRLRR